MKSIKVLLDFYTFGKDKPNTLTIDQVVRESGSTLEWYSNTVALMTIPSLDSIRRASGEAMDTTFGLVQHLETLFDAHTVIAITDVQIVFYHSDNEEDLKRAQDRIREFITQGVITYKDVEGKYISGVTYETVVC